MLSTWTSRAASWRRIGIALTLTLVALVASVGLATAQTAPAAQAPATPAAAPAGRVFAGDLGMLINIVKADKTAEFEALVARAKDALAKNANPDMQKMGAGWRVFKQSEALKDGSIVYMFLIDPVVKGADYTMSKILYDAFPTERQAIYDSIKACLAGTQMVSYQSVTPAAK